MNIALVLSGGTGTRLGAGIPKQYIRVGGRPVIAYCLEGLLACGSIHAVQIVADEQWREMIGECIAAAGAPEKLRGFSAPGEDRQLSVLNGLVDIRGYAADEDYVFIHDAARPVLSGCQIMECLEAAAGHDGVVPVLPMKDTVYASADMHKISSLLDRGSIFAGQAPEVFQIGKYYKAVKSLLPERIWRINGSAEPAVLAGLDVIMIPGDETNFKITTREYFELFGRMIRDRDEKTVKRAVSQK